MWMVSAKVQRFHHYPPLLWQYNQTYVLLIYDRYMVMEQVHLVFGKIQLFGWSSVCNMLFVFSDHYDDKPIFPILEFLNGLHRSWWVPNSPGYWLVDFESINDDISVSSNLWILSALFCEQIKGFWLAICIKNVCWLLFLSAIMGISSKWYASFGTWSAL